MTRKKYRSGRQIIDVTDFGSIDFGEEILICVPRFAWSVARSYLSIQAQWESSYATEYFKDGYTGPSVAQLDIIKANIADFLEVVDMTHKLFSGIVEEGLLDPNLDAGYNTLDGTAVPSGVIHVVKSVAVRYDGTSGSLLQVQVANLADDLIIFEITSPTNLRWFTMSFISVYLQEGDYLRVMITGATAGDRLYLRYAGYKFDAP